MQGLRENLYLHSLKLPLISTDKKQINNRKDMQIY